MQTGGSVAPQTQGSQDVAMGSLENKEARVSSIIHLGDRGALGDRDRVSSGQT